MYVLINLPLANVTFICNRMFACANKPRLCAAILTVLDGQLYTVLGQPDGRGRWQLRLWWKPFVTLIWFGGVLIALGGALSLLGRVRRERRTAIRTHWA